MNKDFDFKQVGKRMPYEVPEGFFDEMEQNVMAEVKTDIAKAQKSRWRRRLAWGTIAGAAAAVALLLTVNLRGHDASGYTDADVDRAFAQLQPADQEFLLEVYDEDVFISGQY